MRERQKREKESDGPPLLLQMAASVPGPPRYGWRLTSSTPSPAGQNDRVQTIIRLIRFLLVIDSRDEVGMKSG